MHTIVKLAVVAALAVTPTAGAWAQTAEPAPVAAEATPATPAAPAAEPAPATEAAAPAPEAAPAPAAVTGPTVTFTTREGQPSFVMSTADKAAFAMVGAFAMISEGKRIAGELQLTEPANVVGAQIAAAFAASKGGSVAPETILVTDKKQDLIASNAGKAAYVVDVAPVGLNAIYFSTDWSHYGLMYGTNVRVFDAASGKQIGKAKCFIKPQKTETSPTYAELLADNGAVLRKLIDEANTACVQQLKTGLGL